MAFTSYDFFVFFVIVFILYWAVRQTRWQNLILLIASYYFYGSVQIWYALLLGASTLGDFWLAKGMGQTPSRKKLYMSLSLALNLGVLAFFKYADFFIGDAASFFKRVGLGLQRMDSAHLTADGFIFFHLKKTQLHVRCFARHI